MSLTRQFGFSAAVRLGHPEWTESENRRIFGDDYAPTGTGHNYSGEVEVTGPWDPDTGILINIREVKSVLNTITQDLDHKFLNDHVSYFRENPPTLENIAQFIFSRCEHEFHERGLKLLRVRLYQTEDCFCDIRAD